MNTQQQINHFDEAVARMRKILIAKGDDYAGESDRLNNFKLVAEIAGTTPDIVALVLIGVKVVRLGTLLNAEGEPKNELISDSVLDLGNYTMLLDMILSEKANKGICANPDEVCPSCKKVIIWRAEWDGWYCPDCKIRKGINGDFRAI